MPRDKRPLIIGLTGNIGSGKSVAARWFEDRGYPVISTDILGHEALLKPKIINRLVEVFGKMILDGKGAIDRKVLGKHVFGNRERLARLSAIVHPEIRNDLSARIDSLEKDIVIVEIPLLFESGLEHCVDFILLIHVDEQTQLDRLKKRDNLETDEILRRIRSQTNIDKKLSLSDLAIENSNSIDALYRKLEDFCGRLREIERKKVVRFDECTINTKEEQ